MSDHDEFEQYPRIETRHAGRKRFRVVYDEHHWQSRPRYFKTYDQAAEHLDRWLHNRDMETWRPIV